LLCFTLAIVLTATACVPAVKASMPSQRACHHDTHARPPVPACRPRVCAAGLQTPLACLGCCNRDSTARSEAECGNTHTLVVTVPVPVREGGWLNTGEGMRGAGGREGVRVN
jgi:hypothetical protein